MRNTKAWIVLLVLASAIAIASSTGAIAQEQELAPRDFLDKTILSGFRLDRPTAVIPWGDLTVLQVPLTEVEADRVAAAISLPKKLSLMGTGTRITEPSWSGGLQIMDFVPLEFTPYYYWVTVLNPTTKAVTADVSFQLKGPSKFKVSGSVVVPALSFSVIYTQQAALNNVGWYRLKTKVKSAGTGKANFCAGC